MDDRRENAKQGGRRAQWKTPEHRRRSKDQPRSLVSRHNPPVCGPRPAVIATYYDTQLCALVTVYAGQAAAGSDSWQDREVPMARLAARQPNGHLHRGPAAGC